MPVAYKIIILGLATIYIIWVSRASLGDIESHGFYRFFAWEGILILFLMNMNDWFVDPFSPSQLLSWAFLIVSLLLIYEGVRLFRVQGSIDQNRQDSELIGIEKTTELVTTGIYRYIRHPFYSSLLFLGWGILLKKISLIGIALAVIASLLLFITARKEEIENLRYFGEPYRDFMKKTKMFVPYIL